MRLPPQLPPALERRLDEAVRLIVQRAQPQAIILFGSCAEGARGPDSDVDLLVVAETDERAELAAELREMLEPVFEQQRFDLLVCTPRWWERARHVHGFVTREADRKGVRIHEAA